MTSAIFNVANAYVADYAQLDPIYATRSGDGKHDEHLTDFSPEGIAARNDFFCRNRTTMQELTVTGPPDRIAQTVFIERMDRFEEGFDGGDLYCDLAVFGSPVHVIREVFDLMSRATTEDWGIVATRLAAVPRALSGFTDSLRHGKSLGWTAPRSAVLACIRSCRAWAGLEPNVSSYFDGLLTEYVARPAWDRKVEDRLRKGTSSAAGAYAGFAAFLAEEYLPAAANDAAGQERYERAARHILGADIQLYETYGWGWKEIERIRSEIDSTCAEILPGAGLREVVQLLDDDHERMLHGEGSLRDWLQTLVLRAIEDLNGKHFDIPAPLQRIEVRVAPPGGVAHQYYRPPTANFSRPGTYWIPTTGRTQFPMWRQVTTAYHEGVPGHHLQEGLPRCMPEALPAFSRNLFVAGHGEGWALYAEQLMQELGYLERPEYRLGKLTAELFRAARLVIDLGVHLGLKFPSSAGPFSGNVWTVDIASAFLAEQYPASPDFVSGEIGRYVSQPAQAISYKVGERVWLSCRESYRRRQGADFDLRAFHSSALALGPMGLEQFEAEIESL